MTGLDEKAGGSPEVVLSRDLQGRAFRILEDELLPADEITEEGQFPEYGDFLPCDTGENGEDVYVEVPESLAQRLVSQMEAGEREGRWFLIETARKTPAGAWRFSIEIFEDEEAVEAALTGSA